MKLSDIIMNNKTKIVCLTIVVRQFHLLPVWSKVAGSTVRESRRQHVAVNKPMVYLALKDVKINDLFWESKIKFVE